MSTWGGRGVLAGFTIVLLAACSLSPSSQPTNTPPTLMPTASPSSQVSRQMAPCQPAPDPGGQSPYPAPTGSYQVGVTAFQLVDSERPELYDGGDQTDHRTVTIYVWYPADVASDAVPCSYVSTFDRANSGFNLEVALRIRSDIGPGETYTQLSAWPLYAFPDAPVSSDQTSYPVVIYSTFASGLPIMHSSQFQELASYGYIVVDVIHTYGYSTVLEPGFKVNGQSIEYGDLERSNALDLSFVVNQLAELQTAAPESPLAGHFNLDQIGVAGWESGGIAAVLASAADPRIKAVILLHGEPRYGENGWDLTLKQPGLYVRSEGGPVYNNATGPALLVKISGFSYGTYTDFALWPHARSDVAGSIDGLRAIHILNTYLIAFCDQYLRGIDQPLLNGPSPDYPEVAIESRNIEP